MHRLLVIILELSHPTVWLVRHVCTDKAEVSFFEKEDRFLMLFQTCTKLMFGLSDILVITVIARNRINSVGSLFFRDRILRFSENMLRMLLLCRVYKGGLLERGFLERIFFRGVF